MTFASATLLFMTLLSAQDSPAPPTEPEAPLPAPRHDTLVVIGESDAQADPALAGSADVVAREQITDEHVDDTAELFNKVPGVYLSRFNQGILNAELAIRGFAGDGTTPHAKLLIDGIPAQLHNGFGELDQLFPLALDSISVFKGTSDARYGIYNTAGHYGLHSRSDLVPAEIELALGSFRTSEVQGYFAKQLGSLTQNYFLGYRSSEGYRDHTDLEKYAASGRWAYAVTDGSTLSLSARVSGYEGDAPGYLSKAEARRAPRSSAEFANQDGGEKTVGHLGLQFDRAIGERGQWRVVAYGQRFERERWVRFSAAGALQNRYDEQDHQGLATTLGWQLDERWLLDGGLDFERQDVLEQRFGTIGQTRRRDTTRVLRDFSYDLETTGGFLRLGHTPNERFSWNLGLRLDQLAGDFVATNASGVRTPRRMFEFGTIMQPKLNVFYSPSAKVTVFLNAGRGFQHPFGSDAYTSGDRSARDVSLNDGWETGVKLTPTERVEVRLSVWGQRAQDEFVVVDGLARNVGATDRRGFDAGARWQVSDRIYVWASATTIATEIRRAADAQAAFTGNDLRSVPDFTGSLGVQIAISPRLEAGIHVDAQGDYAVNEANLGGRFGEFALVHLTAGYETPWGRLGLQVNNVFDEFYEYVFDFGQTGLDTIHSPGDGIAGTLSFRFRLGTP